MLIGHRTSLKLTAGMSRFAVAAALLTLSGCGGGSGGSQVSASAALNSGLSTPALVVPGWAQFIYPASGQLSVEASRPFEWTSVPGSQAYQLQVGTSAGASDVFDSGIITTTSVVVPNLPAAQTLYARVRAIPAGWSTALTSGFPRGTYVTFRPDVDVSGATITYPAAGSTAEADTPISWQPDSLARNYRLTIGTTVGGTDLLDTGPILTARRVVSGLRSDARVHATLYTNYSGNVTHSQAVSFVVGNASTTAAAMLTVARTLAGQVRDMADDDNQPYDATPLAAATAAEGDAVADCAAFTTALLAELSDANLPLQVRELAVCFNDNSYDCHALVEVFDTDSQRWIPLDPTFGLYALNSQGQPATAQEISTAARARAFDQLSFIYLTAAGDAYARAYYIDYPLLFLDVFQPGSDTALVQPSLASLQPYFDLMGPSVNSAAAGYYAAQCGSGYSSATADWDGIDQTYACSRGFTPILWGMSVSVIQGNPSASAIWQTHRFVF
jgi:hypothetical protein